MTRHPCAGRRLGASAEVVVTCACALLGATLLVPRAGAAQTSDAGRAAQPADGSSDTLQEVVVTAEKRSANMMTTAVAMNALSGRALETAGVTNLEGLAAVTPSLTYDNQGPTAAVNIRGIGLSVSSPNVAPGVPLYRDGLLAPTLLPNEPLLDIADVEVLRGPQGTLVGSNSTGGAVFFNTRSPMIGRNDGFATVEGGNYARLKFQGAHDIPVNDVLALRIAASYEKRDTFWKDLYPTSADHPPPGALNQLVARIGMLYQPSDQLSVLLKVNYQDDQNGGMAHTPQAGTNAAAAYPPGRYILAYQDPNTEYSDYQVRAGLEIKYLFPDGITLRSMSGFFYTYEYYDDQQYVDPTPTTYASAPFINRINDHVYSQEFNLLSPADARLHWVAGTFSQHWPAHINLNPNTQAVLVDEGTIKDSNALFGEVGYDLTSSVEMHLGLRETFDHAYGSGGVYIIPAGRLEVQSNRVGQTDDALTGRIGVNWKATPTQFFYAFFAKGAKTGGINGAGVPNFAPETVYDFELGLKSSWLDGHLRSELGAFYSKYDNLQLSVLQPSPGSTPLGAISNVGRSTVDGIELELQSQFGGLQVNGNLAYIHSRIGSSPALLDAYLYEVRGLSPTGVQCAPGETSGCFDFSPYYRSVNGAANPYAPEWTANVGAQYAIALRDGATVTPRVDFSYVSAQWATIFDNPVDRFQPRHGFNLSLAYALGTWQFTAYGTNVTGDYYITGQTGPYNFWSSPPEFGLRISKAL